MGRFGAIAARLAIFSEARDGLQLPWLGTKTPNKKIWNSFRNTSFNWLLRSIKNSAKIMSLIGPFLTLAIGIVLISEHLIEQQSTTL